MLTSSNFMSIEEQLYYQVFVSRVFSLYERMSHRRLATPCHAGTVVGDNQVVPRGSNITITP